MNIKALGLRLAKMRDAAGFSQDALALKSGVARNAISNLEKGRGNPTVGTLEALAKALGVPFTELFGGQTTKAKASDEPAVLDATGGAEILAKYQGLSPSLRLLACAVLHENPAILRQLEPGARQILSSLLEAFQKQLRSRA